MYISCKFFLTQTGIWLSYHKDKNSDSEGPLFWKSTIPTNPKPNLKADPNPNSNSNRNLNLNFNPNVSTVARICTIDFQSSGSLE